MAIRDLDDYLTLFPERLQARDAASDAYNLANEPSSVNFCPRACITQGCSSSASKGDDEIFVVLDKGNR